MISSISEDMRPSIICQLSPLSLFSRENIVFFIWRYLLIIDAMTFPFRG